MVDVELFAPCNVLGRHQEHDNVSNHLTCLRDCGIVVAEPEGRQTRYEISDPPLTRSLADLVDVVLAAAAVAWQFSRKDPERWEKGTLRVIAFSFFALAAYVTINAVLSLTGVLNTEHSIVGIALTALSMVVMPVLPFIERRTGRELGSAAAVADSKQTLICTYLSAAVLIGLLLNLLFGWTCADPIAALAIVYFAIREGTEAWKGDTRATPIGMLLDDDTEHSDR